MTPSNRARLLVLLSFPVVIGIALAIRSRPYAATGVTLLFWGEISSVVGVLLNARRIDRHQTWRQVLAPGVEAGAGYVIVVGGLLFLLWVFGVVAKNWEIVGPILAVIGVSAGVLAIALLVLYLVVRVVRVAWKGR